MKIEVSCVSSTFSKKVQPFPFNVLLESGMSSFIFKILQIADIIADIDCVVLCCLASSQKLVLFSQLLSLLLQPAIIASTQFRQPFRCFAPRLKKGSSDAKPMLSKQHIQRIFSFKSLFLARKS